MISAGSHSFASEDARVGAARPLTNARGACQPTTRILVACILSAMLQISLAATSFIIPLSVPVEAPVVQQVAMQRAVFGPSSSSLLFPSIALAKEEAVVDYTRGLEELNGIDIWANIPGSSEVNEAKGTGKAGRYYKRQVSEIRSAGTDEVPAGYKSIQEEIEEERAAAAKATASAKKASRPGK